MLCSERCENLPSLGNITIFEFLSGSFRKGESTFTFAERAREEFKNGDIAKRRQILTSLGTEHILKDRQIYIQTEEPLIVLQKMADENNRIQDMLEPPKDIGNKEHLKDLYSKSSLMCSQ